MMNLNKTVLSLVIKKSVSWQFEKIRNKTTSKEEISKAQDMVKNQDKYESVIFWSDDGGFKSKPHYVQLILLLILICILSFQDVPLWICFRFILILIYFHIVNCHKIMLYEFLRMLAGIIHKPFRLVINSSLPPLGVFKNEIKYLNLTFFRKFFHHPGTGIVCQFNILVCLSLGDCQD